MWTDLKSICPTRVESDPTETEWIPRAAAKVPQAAADHFDWILKGWLRLLLLPTWRDSSSSKSTLFCTLTRTTTRTRAKHTHSLNLPITCAHAHTHVHSPTQTRTHTLTHTHSHTHAHALITEIFMMMSKSKSVKSIQNGDQSRAGPDQNVPTKIFFLLEKRFSYFGSLCFKMLRPVDLMQWRYHLLVKI